MVWVDWTRVLNPRFLSVWTLELVKNSSGLVTNYGFCKTKSKSSLILGCLRLTVLGSLIDSFWVLGLGSVWILTQILGSGSGRNLDWD